MKPEDSREAANTHLHESDNYDYARGKPVEGGSGDHKRAPQAAR